MARASRSQHCLIFSFIGNTDLKAFNIDPPDARKGAASPPGYGRDISPLKRLLQSDASGAVDPKHSRLILFDDDLPEFDGRQRFCEKIEDALEKWDLQGMKVERVPLPGVKTDRKELYDGVWQAIPRSGGYGRYIFHVSSGGFPMQATLLLAAATFPFPPGSRVDIYETSRQEDVQKLDLPYILALREVKQRERPPGLFTLSADMRQGLLDHTVVEDPEAQHAYAALYRVAQRWREVAGKGTALERESVLIKGPCGCGKWHAARQLAHWSGRTLQVCGGPDELPQAPEPGTLLGIRELESWDEAALRRLRHWRDRHLHTPVVATWRIDQKPQTSLQSVKAVLGAPKEVLLPALEHRSDIRELVKALAARHGIPTGKLDEHFQYEALAEFPDGLHDLEGLIVNAHAYRTLKKQVDEKGLGWAKRQQEANTALDALWRHARDLAAFRFGSGQPPLKERLKLIERAVVAVAAANGRTQREIAKLLGISKSAVDRIQQQAAEDGFGPT